MEAILRQAGEIVLERARGLGMAAEAFILYSRDLTVNVRQGEVETLKEAEELGLGLRVFSGGRMGFAYTTDLSLQALREVTDKAAAISAHTAADENNRFVRGGYAYPVLEVFDPCIADTSLESKVEMARDAERAARAVDPRIKLVEKAGYEDSEYCMLVMNTNGVYAYGKGNYCGLFLFLVADDDRDCQNGFAFMHKRKIAALAPQSVGQEAALRGLRSLGARSMASGRMPCVMEPYVVTRFMSILAQSVCADAVQKGKSLLAGKIGQQVASRVVNLRDDATYQEGLGSFPFDGEGVPAQSNILVEQGQLKDYLYDSYTAFKAGRESSGSGWRGSFRSLPAAGTSNFILGPGQESPEKLIQGIERGLYVTDVMGMHTANPISGDFSVGAAGIMIEKGRLTYPVRGMTIAGNLSGFLQDMDAAGNDLSYYGGKAAPTIRLQQISVSGQ